MSIIKRQLAPIPFTDVTFDDAFWAPRIEANRAVTIPHYYRQCEATGRISAFDLNFKRALPAPVVLIFQDSDIAKWIEAAAYSLATHPDSALEAQVDGVIDKIVRAQQPDGYLNTHFTVSQPEMRFRNLRDWHELYCAGHLIEGAVAYYQATGKRKLLEAMCRYVDLIGATFGPQPGQKRGYCGHPEIELALVKLYHATDEPRYLELAAYFVDERGQQPNYYDQEARARGEDPADFPFKTYEYCQAHVPLRQQDKVVGHAVRAMYLLSAVADLSYERDDPSLWKTCLRLWNNLVTKRIYLTGGIGPASQNEGFTQDYDLPDETAYAETCATIGMIQWNHRMLQISGEAKFADEIERGLYNGLLSSVALEGGRFFYENPLASAGHHHRQGWFDCPCCPPNIARTLASLGQFFYSGGPNGAWVHLFAQSHAKVRVGEAEVHLRQETRYPWDGAVRITLSLERPGTFPLHVRVPGWCERWQVSVNGVPVNLARASANGYLSLEREWQSGDVVEYSMDMPVQVIWAHPAVRDLRGRVALQRGPLVYCVEGVDHPGLSLAAIQLTPKRAGSSGFDAEYREDLLGGVMVLRGQARLASHKGWERRLYRNRAPVLKPIDIVAVPYYAWDNRDAGEMRVWLQTGK
jgi:DUF1680 family protein